MRKYLTLIFIFFTYISFAQYNENAPWLQQDQKNKNAVSKLTFAEISQKFNTYFINKDWKAKGSGYKPFKRWEDHWKNYLYNGQVAAPSELWSAWKQKKAIAKKYDNTSNWTTVGPYTTNIKSGQGRINTFIIDPNNSNTFYVGAPSGGLWKSTDKGVNWTPLTDDLPQIGVSGIAIDPNNSNIIYIVTGDDDARDTYSVGVMKSTDGGKTWNKTGLKFDGPNSSANEIIINPDDPKILWVATNQGFYRTDDAGENWRRKLSGNIRDIKMKPNDPQTIYAVTSSEFHKSTNGGVSFNKITSNLPTNSSRLTIGVSPANSEIVYVLSANKDNSFNGIYRSTDSGTTFNKSDEEDDIFSGSKQAWYDMALTVSPTDPNTLFVGVLDIWKSTSGGDDFTQLNRWWNTGDENYTHADIHFLRFYKYKLYAGTDGGIYQSSDNGKKFKDLTENLVISQYYRIATARTSKEYIVGGLQDNGGFGYNNNAWYRYHGGDGMDCAIDPNNNNTYYGFTQYGNSLNVTYNAGVTSSGQVTSAPEDEVDDSNNDSGGSWVTPLALSKNGDIYAGYQKLYKLNDNKTWEAVSDKVFGGDLNSIRISNSDPELIYVSRGSELYKSTDGGTTFIKIDYPFESSITSIEINNNDNSIVYVTIGGFYSNGVLRSTDGGAKWTDIDNNLPPEPKFIIKHQSQSPDNDLYVGTSLGVYHINDKMLQWEVFSNNLPNVPIKDLEINVEDKTLTAGTYGRGVWQTPIVVHKVGNDISLLQVVNNNTVSCGGLTPKIIVKNNGLNDITTVDINYEIDGTPYNHQFNGNISTDQTQEILLPETNGLNFGNHRIQVETTINGDTFADNNTISAEFLINNSSSGKYINTFGDVNPDEWIVETIGNTTELWQRGIPTTSKFKDLTQNAYITNPTGNYTDETTSYLISPCYDLTRMENPVLKFKMAFDIEENWDVLYMEYTTDQGLTWNILGSSDDPNWYNSSYINDERPVTVGKQWTGTQSSLQEYSYNLAALNDEENIIFRFVFATDQATNGEGALIDDFTIDATAVLAVNNLEKKSFNLYPNPSRGTFYIQREGNEEMQISVYDLTGKMVYKKNRIIQNFYEINLDHLSRGIYFIKIIQGNQQAAKRLILE
jgi:photosystem II stability/assembly factor-like uncharacterized protein